MADPQGTDRTPPSTRQLAKTTGIAAGIAVVVLIVAVLPAEFGIDPTGIGGALGLKAEAGSGPSPYDGPGEPFSAQPAPYRSIRVNITVPGSGDWFEWKFHMDTGDAIVYSWEATGPVRSDLHGEPFNQTLGSASYHDTVDRDHSGSLTAPFAGKQGWAWRNEIDDQDIHLVLHVSGYWHDTEAIGVGDAVVTAASQGPEAPA